MAGRGITRALACQVTDEVCDGRLQTHEPPHVPVHLVYPAGRTAAAKVRLFVQFAAERLRALPVLQGRARRAGEGEREGEASSLRSGTRRRRRLWSAVQS